MRRGWGVGGCIDPYSRYPPLPRPPLPPVQFSKIAAVEDAPPGAMLDVVGVVEAAAEWSTITKKDGTETQVGPVRCVGGRPRYCGG